MSVTGRGEAGRLAVGFYTSLAVGNLRAMPIDVAKRFPQLELQMFEGQQRGDEFARLNRPLRSLACENFGVGDEISVERRRQLDCERDRLQVFDRAELELRHRSPLHPA